MPSASGRTVFALAVLALALARGPVAAENATATPEEVAAQISGKWVGSMINGNGRYFPATATLSGSNGKITGVADLPESPADKAPKLTGTYSGSAVEIASTSEFDWHLVMSKDSTGKYHLDGTYVTMRRGFGKAVLVKE